MMSAKRPSRLSTLHKHSQECFLVHLTCVMTGYCVYDKEGDMSDKGGHRFWGSEAGKVTVKHGKLHALLCNR